MVKLPRSCYLIDMWRALATMLLCAAGLWACNEAYGDAQLACAELCAYGEECASEFFLPPTYQTLEECEAYCLAGLRRQDDDCLLGLVELSACYRNGGCYSIPAPAEAPAACRDSYTKVERDCRSAEAFPPRVRICWDQLRRVYVRCL